MEQRMLAPGLVVTSVAPLRRGYARNRARAELIARGITIVGLTVAVFGLATMASLFATGILGL